MLITEDQKRLIVESGISLIGQTKLGLNCSGFVKRIYAMADIDIDFCDCPILSFSEINKAEVTGCILFLHRRETKVLKRITHMGIIFPDNQLLHYSRWMNSDHSFYQVSLSPFSEIFKVYDYVEP